MLPKLLSVGALLGFAAMCLAARAAQDYPARPIRIIDGFAAGGNTDVLARIIGQKLHERWGQPVIVENRPGAAGNVGAEIAAKASPGGYTLLMGWTTTIAISKTLYPKLSYDAVRDLAPVGLVASSLLILLVHPSLAVNSLSELVTLAKAHSGPLTYASAGVGSGTHLAMELFKRRAGINVLHVAYKGGPPAVAAIAAGEAQIGFSSLASSLPLTKSNKLRAIAVSTPMRSSALPDVPTIAESGFPGFDITTWYGLFVPIGTPRTIVEQLNAEVAAVLKHPDVVERLKALGLEPKTSTPEQFGTIFRQEIALYAKVIKDAGVRLE